MSWQASRISGPLALWLAHGVAMLKQQYTIVIVTHSMQQAARVSDKTAFFHLGNLIEEGDTSKIFTKPDNQKTNDYITGRFG